MPALVECTLEEIDAAISRGHRGEQLADEAGRLAGSLRDFVRAAWHIVVPNTTYVHGWHIDAICDHLEAVSAGEIRRLQVWVPPGTMKSSTCSILWPVWEWASRPEIRYLTASYDIDLATGFAVKSRDLLRSAWFQSRWPHVELKRDQDLKRSYANTAGGSRVATSPNGPGTGRHADRILIDDPLNAREIASEAALAEVADWHDGTLATRWADPKTGAEVIIQQRLAERDLAGHVLPQADWTVLCLPEAYEQAHPYAWRGDPRNPDASPAVVEQPLREDETAPQQDAVPQGEAALLWPQRVGPAEHGERLQILGAHRAAGQLQQRPAAREGSILKRSGWRFFPQRHLDDDERDQLPRFTLIVQSWDTAFKDKTSSDYVVGTVWGQILADLYLLRVVRDRMSLSLTKAAMREITGWADTRFGVPQRILIEKSANGVEIIEELKRELRGVTPVVASTSKVARAEAAEPALEAGNVFVPGERSPDAPSGYNEALTPAFTQALIEECALFPGGEHDDQVDSFTQAVNWTRGRSSGPARSMSAAGLRVPGRERRV